MATAVKNTNEPAPTLLEGLLRQQQTLTAVEQFAQAHEQGGAPAQEKYYRDLIPVGPPGQGEQYAFEVDLDACSGCKACVTACNRLNGLEEDELWRNVGQLVGGTAALPVVQHVTTACHHCVEPACLHGCPVEAYEKDPDTGVVRHLDDQCIGCQYCMLKCPYDVPVYSHEKGIVRKCDMCHQRLAAGEAPACVQSCPNQAIRIRIVDQEKAREDSEVDPFLPAAPDPAYTLPTTLYKSERPAPRNLLPADYFSVQKAHGHLPLVVMLVLTQMSVGAFVVEHAMYYYSSLFAADAAQAARPLHLLTALLLGALGFGAAIFHLGRPLYAYRALLGLRTSWLSREILAFNLFAATAVAYVGAALLSVWGVSVPEVWQSGLSLLACVAGVAAVFSSVMVYVDTHRPLWTFSRTTAMFLLTAAVLGLPTALLVSLGAAAASDSLTIADVMRQYGRLLCQALIAAAVVKLVLELSIYGHLGERHHTPLKRSALLLSGELSIPALRRFFFGFVGGVALPLMLLAEASIARDGFHPLFVGVVALLMLGVLIAGELLERYLFFAASVAPKMPGEAAA